MAASEAARLPVAPLLLGSALGLALLHAGSQAVHSNDLHIYLAQGRWMVAHRALLERDVFTWTAAGTPYINATWGWCLLSWGLHALGGLEALRLAKALAVTGALGLIAAAARARGASLWAAAVAAVYAWFLIFQNTAVRGQSFAFPIFAGLIALLSRPRPPWLTLVGGGAAGLAWSALHGSFPAGLAWCAAAAAGDAWAARSWRAGRAAAAAGLGLLAGSCAGPYGPMIWTYIAENSALSAARNISEWLPPSPAQLEGAKFYGALGLWSLLLLRGWRRLDTRDLLVLAGFAWLGGTGTRFVAWFALASAPPLAVRLGRGRPAERGLPARLLRPIYGLAIAGWPALLIAGLRPDRAAPLHPETPVALVDALAAEGDSGRLFGPPEYGGYVSWRLYPGWLQSGDIRTWLFDDATWDRYLSISRADPGWEALLDEGGVTHILTLADFHGEGLQPAAAASERWELVAEDRRGALFRRRR